MLMQGVMVRQIILWRVISGASSYSLTNVSHKFAYSPQFCPNIEFPHHKTRDRLIGQWTFNWIFDKGEKEVNVHKYLYHRKGSLSLPKRMNFRKSSKRPLTPPHFWKIMLRVFLEAKQP